MNAVKKLIIEEGARMGNVYGSVGIMQIGSSTIEVRGGSVATLSITGHGTKNIATGTDVLISGGTVDVLNATGNGAKYGGAIAATTGSALTIKDGTITVTVTSNTGYKLKSLTVNGTALTANESGVYSFTMPEQAVTLTAVFEKLETVIEQDTTVSNGTASVVIPDDAINDAVDAVGSAEEKVITIIPTDTGSADKMEVSIPAASLGTIANADAALLRLAITYLVELILCGVFAIFLCKNFTLKFSSYYLRKGLKIGLPLSFVALLSAITNFGDKHFVMLYCGVGVVAVYNLASLLATIPVIVYQSFNFIWLPSFLQEKNLSLLKKKTDRNGLRIFILLLLCYLGLVL